MTERVKFAREVMGITAAETAASLRTSEVARWRRALSFVIMGNDRSRQGQAPFGFRWQDGSLLIEEKEAAARRVAFELYVKLKSLSAVARELTAKGHQSRRGGKWSDVQVARILQCPSAIGRYEVGRSEVDAQGKRKPTDEAERDVIECEPIISRAVWERVSNLLAERKITRVDEPKTPLSGLVWCQCGEKMKLGATTEKFTCSTCRIAVPMEDLETIFSEDFAEMVASHPLLAAALSENAPGKEYAAELAGLDDKRTTAERKRQSVESMFIEKSITKERFEELHRPLDQEVTTTAQQITTLKRKLSQQIEDQNPPRPFPEIWPTIPEIRRRRIIASFVERFVVGSEEIEIAYLLPEPSAPKDDTSTRQITPSTNQLPATGGPLYIRLPKPGELCPYTGLSRAKLNELILPNERNHFRPLVASKSLKKEGQQRGVRLILLESLLAFLAEH